MLTTQIANYLNSKNIQYCYLLSLKLGNQQQTGFGFTTFGEDILLNDVVSAENYNNYFNANFLVERWRKKSFNVPSLRFSEGELSNHSLEVELALHTDLSLSDIYTQNLFSNSIGYLILLAFDPDNHNSQFLLLLYRGIFDYARVIYGKDSKFTIAFANEFLYHDYANQRKHNHFNQQILYPTQNDKGFEFLKDLKNVKLKW